MFDFNRLLFGIYPYIALTIFLVGSLLRFDREQYTWKSDSSQLLRRGQLRLGSNLFHIGILALFGGHAVGLLTPHEVYVGMGLSVPTKQLLAMVAGGVFGGCCLVGITLLTWRRLADRRIRANSKPMDIVILLWIFATLLLGLSTIIASAQHRDGSEMLKLAGWAQSIVTLHGGAADLLLGTHPIFRLHLFFGMTLFLLFPFSRLVHVWSGFATGTYLIRAWQLVRRRGPRPAGMPMPAAAATRPAGAPAAPEWVPARLAPKTQIVRDDQP